MVYRQKETPAGDNLTCVIMFSGNALQDRVFIK
jgi:hypothetical protein